MKIYLLILAFLVSACSNPNAKQPKNILPETSFKNLLKEIHLTEAAFKIENKNLLKTKLKDCCSGLYRKYNISAEDFKNTIDFYSKNTETLEKIYSDILEELNKERSKLDQK